MEMGSLLLRGPFSIILFSPSLIVWIMSNRNKYMLTRSSMYSKILKPTLKMMEIMLVSSINNRMLEIRSKNLS
jgi:hypothetical protein